MQLYQSVASCATAGRYDDAVDFFALAGVYGRYDSLRVADPSAHQIVGFLKNRALDSVPVAQRSEFQKAAGAAYDAPDKHQALCDRVKAIGKPAYFPAYMVNHGIDAAIAGLQAASAPAPLVSPFDADSAWLKSLSSYLGCQ